MCRDRYRDRDRDTEKELHLIANFVSSHLSVEE